MTDLRKAAEELAGPQLEDWKRASNTAMTWPPPSEHTKAGRPDYPESRLERPPAAGWMCLQTRTFLKRSSIATSEHLSIQLRCSCGGEPTERSEVTSRIQSRTSARR